MSIGLMLVRPEHLAPTARASVDSFSGFDQG